MLTTNVHNFISFFGSVSVEYENKNGKFKKKLSFKKNNYLLLKPKTWCKIHFIDKNSKLLVLFVENMNFRTI